MWIGADSRLRSSAPASGDGLRFTGRSSFRAIVGNAVLSEYAGFDSMFVGVFPVDGIVGLGFNETSLGVHTTILCQDRISVASGDLLWEVSWESLILGWGLFFISHC